MSLLSVENLSTQYDEHKVLNNVSFKIEEGEFVCLCGPNGSGKSTLFKCLANILPFTGKILVDNQNIAKMKRTEIAKKEALLTQNETSLWNFSVYDFVSMGRFTYGDEESVEAQKIIDDVLEKLELYELSRKNVNEISGGEFQKARLARTLVQKSRLLLLDEPVANLDFNYQFSLLSKLKNYCRENKVGALVSIHDLNLASVFADRVLLLGNENAAIGSVDQIYQAEVLEKAFGTKFGLYQHPEYKAVQVYVKDV